MVTIMAKYSSPDAARSAAGKAKYTSPDAARSAAGKGGMKPKTTTTAPAKIKVSQSTINGIKSLGMKTSLKLAGMNAKAAKGGVAAEFNEGVRRMYGDRRYNIATGATKPTTPKATKPKATSPDAARRSATTPKYKSADSARRSSMK